MTRTQELLAWQRARYEARRKACPSFRLPPWESRSIHGGAESERPALKKQPQESRIVPG